MKVNRKIRTDTLAAARKLGMTGGKKPSSSSNVETLESDFCCFCSTKYVHGQDWFQCEHCFLRYCCARCIGSFQTHHEAKCKETMQLIASADEKTKKDEEDDVIVRYNSNEKAKSSSREKSGATSGSSSGSVLPSIRPTCKGKVRKSAGTSNANTSRQTRRTGISSSNKTINLLPTISKSSGKN